MSEETPTVKEVSPVVEEVSCAIPKPVMSAREKAEARRRRILEKGRDRMKIFTGEESVESVTADPIPEAPDSTETKEETEEAVTDDAAAEENEGDASAPAVACKPSGSSRLAQMRRRRYKKAAEAAAKEKEAEEENKTEGDQPDEQEAEPAQEEGEEDQTTTAADENTAVPETGEKKKYLGVIKMRRKRLAEKKKAEEEAVTNELKDMKSQVPKKSPAKSLPLGPILIQLFTAICLFLAGFDVGLQNHVIVKQEVPYIHSNLSYVDHGIGVLTKFGEKGAGASLKSNDLLNTAGVGGEVEFAEEDEFGDVKPKPAGASSDSTKEENIDPLFGVDFDKITAGPGIFLMLARLAVSIHRSISYFCLTLPLSLFHAILAGPKKLFSNPPIMFLCAILIRAVGKYVLGGKIPDLDEIIAAEAKKKEDDKKCELPELSKPDFVSMAKNFVKKFVQGNFPKVVMAFTILKDAKNDMFVVLCGLFVGLIFPLDIMGATIVSEEL